ncbi:MAG: MATE family efflux transporter, partial [Clostridia bacterium]|nr:MATE family efflux transporter [Clostridia bacterium]
MRKKEVDMLSGSVMKGLIAISIPIMVMNVLTSLFSIFDMTILNYYDTAGGYSVGAVGASAMLIALITGLMIGISAGVNVVVARYIGKNDREGVDRTIGSSIIFALIGGVVLLVIGVFFAETFLRWTNCPEGLMSQAVLYFRMYFLGAPILMLLYFLPAILRAFGDSKRPMVYLTIGGIVKIAFTFLFVGVFDMSIVGVGLSTIISWIVSTALTGIGMIKKGGAVKLNFTKIRLYGKQLKEILAVGVPTGFQQAFYSIANVIISATVNTFGADATTGISIANQFDGLLYQIAVAPSLAVMPYVSQNVGACNIKRASESILKGVILSVAFGATVGTLSAVFSAQLSSIMSNNSVVIAYSQQKMVIISSTYFICGINDILGAALKGMGRPVVPMVFTLIYLGALRFVWVYLIFPLYRNLTFLYLVWPVGWTL